MGTSFIFWQYHSVGMSYHSFIPPLNLEGSSRAGWDFLYAVVFLHMHEYIHMQCPLPFGQLHINFLGLILAYNDHMLPSLKRIPTCMLCLPSVHTKSYGQRAFSLCTYSLFLKLLRAPERRGAVQILIMIIIIEGSEFSKLDCSQAVEDSVMWIAITLPRALSQLLIGGGKFPHCSNTGTRRHYSCNQTSLAWQQHPTWQQSSWQL